MMKLTLIFSAVLLTSTFAPRAEAISRQKDDACEGASRLQRKACREIAEENPALTVSQISACGKAKFLGTGFQKCLELAAESPLLTGEKILACKQHIVKLGLYSCLELAAESELLTVEKIEKCTSLRSALNPMYKLHCLQSAAGSEDLSLEKITACSKSTKLGKYFKDCVEAAAESPHLSADKITACGKNAVGPSLSQCYEIAGEKSTSLETVRKCKTRLPLSQKYISCLHGKSSRAEHGNAEEEEDEFAPAGATGAQ